MLNFKITSNYDICIERFSIVEKFKMSEANLWDLHEVLSDLGSIPTLKLEDNQEERTRNEKVRKKFERRWRCDKLTKMTEEEMSVYYNKFVTGNDEFNLYISKAREGLLRFMFVGVKAKGCNVFDINIRDTCTLVEEIKKEIEKALGWM